MRASADATHARLGGPGQWLLNLPPDYVAGLQVLFRSVRAGTEPVVQSGSFDDAVAAMTGERRYVSLVPTQLRAAARTGDRALRGFDAVLVGGARLEPALRARAAAAGVRVVATYGMSETCGGCVYDGAPARRGGGGDRRRRHASGSAGRSLFDGYDGQPDLTAQVAERTAGSSPRTSAGSTTTAGSRVTGRVDDVVISGGVNVPGARRSRPGCASTPPSRRPRSSASRTRSGGSAVVAVRGRGPAPSTRPGTGSRPTCRGPGRPVSSYRSRRCRCCPTARSTGSPLAGGWRPMPERERSARSR